jgi:hypothetical protein
LIYYKGGDFLKLCEVENGAQQDAILGGSEQLPEALRKDIDQHGGTLVKIFQLLFHLYIIHFFWSFCSYFLNQ